MVKTRQSTPKDLDLGDYKNLFDTIYYSKEPEIDLVDPLKNHIKKIIDDSSLKDQYNLIFLYDPDHSIRDYTANQIYKAVSKLESKDILLLLVSPGGAIEPAYFISKICKNSSSRFLVAVPRKAKSAATLLSLGADEIHMGIMSELGPIDPQIKGLPALGLQDAIQQIAQMCKLYPESSDMFAKYLSNKLDLQTFGYFQRISESAKHYAQKLLENKKLPPGITPLDIGEKLVSEYKDHSFVIDRDEAGKILGDIVKLDSDEFKLVDKIHAFLDQAHFAIKVFKKKDISIIGDLENGIVFIDSDN